MSDRSETFRQFVIRPLQALYLLGAIYALTGSSWWWFAGCCATILDLEFLANRLKKAGAATALSAGAFVEAAAGTGAQSIPLEERFLPLKRACMHVGRLTGAAVGFALWVIYHLHWDAGVMFVFGISLASGWTLSHLFLSRNNASRFSP